MTKKAQQDQRRAQYLAAMEIPVWQLREPARAVAQPSLPQDEGMEPVLFDAPDSMVSTPSTHSTDVANMDWSALQAAVVSCTRCGLHSTRIQTVFGSGNQQARWLFVGEAPGAEEDRQGLPFVGRAGQLLNAMLFALDLKREDVYIANVLKCRPPNNRDPQLQEVAQCEPYLIRQIELISPAIIVALGRHAAHSLMKTDVALARLRRQRLQYHSTPLVVTYHPAYLLRNPSDKVKTWEDLCLAREIVEAS